MESINKLAALRVRKSKKSEDELREDYVKENTDVYEAPRLDDPYFEEKQKFRAKYKPLYDRMKNKLES